MPTVIEEIDSSLATFLRQYLPGLNVQHRVAFSRVVWDAACRESTGDRNYDVAWPALRIFRWLGNRRHDEAVNAAAVELGLPAAVRATHRCRLNADWAIQQRARFSALMDQDLSDRDWTPRFEELRCILGIETDWARAVSQAWRPEPCRLLFALFPPGGTADATAAALQLGIGDRQFIADPTTDLWAALQRARVEGRVAVLVPAEAFLELEQALEVHREAGGMAIVFARSANGLGDFNLLTESVRLGVSWEPIPRAPSALAGRLLETLLLLGELHRKPKVSQLTRWLRVPREEDLREAIVLRRSRELIQ